MKNTSYPTHSFGLLFSSNLVFVKERSTLFIQKVAKENWISVTNKVNFLQNP